MQWFILTCWGIGMVFCRRRGLHRFCRIAMAAGLMLSMAMQLWLLAIDGLLSLETALPLHLCGLFGVLSVPMLWHAPRPLWEASAYLAGPAAACTLFFPAVIQCSHPLLMRFAFCQLHVLVALTPVWIAATGKPLPTDPRRTLILGSGYLLFISAFNNAFGTNYLFLRAAPANTPLKTLHSHGQAFFACALVMLCMAVFSHLQGLYCRIAQRRAVITAENR